MGEEVEMTLQDKIELAASALFTLLFAIGIISLWFGWVDSTGVFWER